MGAAGFYLVNHFFDLHFNTDLIVVTGAVSGLLSGNVFGQLTSVIIKRTTTYFKQKWSNIPD